MKCYVSVVCALSVLVALSYAAPMPQSQVIDNVIQNVTSTAFRVIGRVILQSGGLGGGGGGAAGRSSDGGSRVSVVLPTFGPDDDDYDEEEEDEDTNEVSSSSVSSVSTEASTSASSATTTEQGVVGGSSSTAASMLDEADVRMGAQTSTSTSNEPDVSLNVLDARKPNSDTPLDSETLYTSPASESSRTRRDVVRKIRATAEEEAEDQETAASGGNGPSPSDDLANVDADDADRDKRFLPFGGNFGASASGSTGGSGNFLFDIIRRTADGAARAAGTVYRMIAGTDTLGLGLSATASSTRTLTPQLVAGSGATEESDEKDNSPLGAGGVAEIDLAKGGDGYTEGIPGPITRLFVLANRGLANLVQDLILRLAQTSERIVNFKARLVTALI